MGGFCDGEDLYWELREKIEFKISEHKKLVGEDSALVVEVLEDILK